MLHVPSASFAIGFDPWKDRATSVALGARMRKVTVRSACTSGEIRRGAAFAVVPLLWYVFFRGGASCA